MGSTDSDMVDLNTTELLNYTGNVTMIGDGKKLINYVEEVLVYTVLITIMFSMGAGISVDDLKKHLKKPVAISIGAFCQFILVPFVSFLAILIFQVSGPFATGVLINSCCPGGAVSNLFAYLADGDVSLSVAMTSISSAMALFAMPANLWIYSSFVDTGEAVIPYTTVLASLSATVPPAALGFLLKLKLPNYAPAVVRYGSILGLAILVSLMGLTISQRYLTYISAPRAVYLTVCVLPPLTMGMSYLLTWLAKESPAVRKTVAIEASIQNVGLAFAVITLSFPHHLAGPIVVYPALYALAMVITSGIGVAVYQVYKKCRTPVSNPLPNDLEKYSLEPMIKL